MRKNLILFILVSLFCVGAHAQTTTFSYTGGAQVWTVPAGVCMVKVDMKGGDGGASTFGSIGGPGGSIVCTLAVTPGDVYYINVGGAGQDGSSGGFGGTCGAFLSGGAGGSFFATGGGGGGTSDMRLGSNTLPARILAAGGGGGAGDGFCGLEDGGAGGGAIAAGNGFDCGAYNPNTCGEGATPSVPGIGSFGGGAPGVGEVGGDGATSFLNNGGGGGGGYFGGGGGGQFSSTTSSSAGGGGGGGGSSYTDAILASGVSHGTGTATTIDGSVKITIIGVTAVGGTIVGPSTICVGSTITYTNPTGSTGGTWSSSATGVFTVNPTTGAVTAIGTGSGTLTYSVTTLCNTASTSVVLNISTSPAPITGPLSMCALGYDTLFNATGGGVWTSSTPAVATIDVLTGFYTTASAGTTTISYTVGACSAVAVLTVNPNPPAISGPTMVCQGSTISLTNPMSGGTWTSNVPTGVSIGSTSGIATGIIAGASANIFYTLPSGCFTTHFVSVNVPPDPISGPNQTCQGNALPLTDAISGGAWTSGTPAVASVAMTGPTTATVTGLSGGISVISYTKTGCPPALYPVTINPGPAAITGSTAVCTGMATALSSATPGGTWTSSNPSITVTSTTGMVTSSAIGSSGTIYYTLPTGCFTSIVVNVSLGAPAMVGPLNICDGAVDTFTNADPTGLWSSTDLTIAQVIDSSGVVTGISAGTVNISYTLPNGCYAVRTLVVDPLVAGVVNISRYPSGIICEDDVVTIVATPVAGGGSAPAFTWKKFSVTIPGETNDTFLYTATRPTGLHGDVINVFMFPNDGCIMYDSVADSIFMDVAPKNVHPTVSISTTSPTTVTYAGQTVTFFSTVTWGGDTTKYQWFKNSIAIAGATNSTYTTTIYGTATYRCEIIGNPPCMDMVLPIGKGVSNEITVFDFLGVNDLPTGNNTLSLFPNPNTGTFTLSGKLSTMSNNDVRYEVTNMLGQVMYKGQTTPKNGEINTLIKLDNMPSGTYLLQVNTDSVMETFHFVISK